MSPSDANSPQCVTDYDCTTAHGSGGDFCISGKCVVCRDDNDCVVASHTPDENFATHCCLVGDSSCDPSMVNICATGCRSNADCIHNWNGPHCLLHGDAGFGSCEQNVCLSNGDCEGNGNGSYCEIDGGSYTSFDYGTCACRTNSDCAAGFHCTDNGGTTACSPYCFAASDCPQGYWCDPSYTCRARCDDGGSCPGSTPVCDTGNLGRQNGEVLDGSIPGLEWCYACLTSADCPDGEGCNRGQHFCAPCVAAADCTSGVCESGTCFVDCDGGACPGGLLCDNGQDGKAGYCFQCLSSVDCPSGEGCDSRTHRCGGCTGAFGCPPGDFCSLNWTNNGFPGTGACLPTCDVRSCPADRPICAKLIALSNEHSFCFGCLSDADCADAGPGDWCDTSVNQTFTCQLPVTQ